MIDCTDCDESHEGDFDCSKIRCVLCHDIHSFKEFKEGVCPKFYKLALKEKRKHSFVCLFCNEWEKEKQRKKLINIPCIYCEGTRFIDRFVYCCLRGCERCDWQGINQNPEWVPLKKKEKKVLKPNEEECNCPICHENIGKKELVYRLECEHIFHKDCSIRWLKINKICPVCRKEDYHFPFEDSQIKPALEFNAVNEEDNEENEQHKEDSPVVFLREVNLLQPYNGRVLRSFGRRERSESPVLNINTSGNTSRYVSPLTRMNNPLWTTTTNKRTRSPEVQRTLRNNIREAPARQRPNSQSSQSASASARDNSRSRSRSDERRTRPIREQSQQQFSSYSEDAITGRQKQLLAIRRARYFEENMEIAFGHLDENKIKQLAVNPNPAARNESSDPTQLRWRNYAIRGRNLHRVPVTPPINLHSTARKSVRAVTIIPTTNSEQDVVEESSSEESSSKSEYNPSAET